MSLYFLPFPIALTPMQTETGTYKDIKLCPFHESFKIRMQCKHVLLLGTVNSCLRLEWKHNQHRYSVIGNSIFPEQAIAVKYFMQCLCTMYIHHFNYLQLHFTCLACALYP